MATNIATAEPDYTLEPDHEGRRIAAVREALLSIQPESEFGRRLIELSLRGLEEGVKPMSADDILESLGRNRDEDIY